MSKCCVGVKVNMMRGGEPYYDFLVNVKAVCLGENDHPFIPVGQLHQLVPLHCQSAIDNFLEKRTKLRI